MQIYIQYIPIDRWKYVQDSSRPYGDQKQLQYLLGRAGSFFERSYVYRMERGYIQYLQNRTRDSISYYRRAAESIQKVDSWVAQGQLRSMRRLKYHSSKLRGVLLDYIRCWRPIDLLYRDIEFCMVPGYDPYVLPASPCPMHFRYTSAIREYMCGSYRMMTQNENLFSLGRTDSDMDEVCVCCYCYYYCYYCYYYYYYNNYRIYQAQQSSNNFSYQ